MPLTLTESPLQFEPHACLVTGRDDGVIVDLGVDFTGVDPHLYLKAEILEEAASLLGMVPQRDVQKLQQRLTELEADLQELRPQLEALQTVKQVIEGASNGSHDS